MHEHAAPRCRHSCCFNFDSLITIPTMYLLPSVHYVFHTTPWLVSLANDFLSRKIMKTKFGARPQYVHISLPEFGFQCSRWWKVIRLILCIVVVYVLLRLYYVLFSNAFIFCSFSLINLKYDVCSCNCFCLKPCL